EMAHRRHAGGAWHVLHDDIRLTRNVPAEMAGDQARVLVVAAAGRIADHDRHCLAAVEAILRQRWLRQNAREPGHDPGPGGLPGALSGHEPKLTGRAHRGSNRSNPRL